MCPFLDVERFHSSNSRRHLRGSARASQCRGFVVCYTTIIKSSPQNPFLIIVTIVTIIIIGTRILLIIIRPQNYLS